MLRLAAPFLDADELAEVRDVLDSGYLTQGPRAVALEAAVRQITGSKHAFAMSSATTALHLSLVVLGIGPGDEVLVPDFTFPATANVVVQQGARPILVDVHPHTYAVDACALEARITPRTRAIMPVHPFGLSADMTAVMEVAHRHNLAVIEDAACALGAQYAGRPCGALGDIGCFSFHPRKSITTGEGGMMVTDRDDLAERIALLRSHGGVRETYYFRFEDAGFNYRMSDLQAAVGVAQMRKLSSLLLRKRALATQLSMRLQDIPGVQRPVEPNDCYHTYQTYVVVLDSAFDRDRVIAAMHRHRVETTLGTYALHAQPYFQRTYGYADGDLPVAYRLFRQTLSLPCYAGMEDRDVDHVVDALAAALAEVS